MDIGTITSRPSDMQIEAHFFQSVIGKCFGKPYRRLVKFYKQLLANLLLYVLLIEQIHIFYIKVWRIQRKLVILQHI